MRNDPLTMMEIPGLTTRPVWPSTFLPQRYTEILLVPVEVKQRLTVQTYHQEIASYAQTRLSRWNEELKRKPEQGEMTQTGSIAGHNHR
jgi:hypothetical protein